MDITPKKRSKIVTLALFCQKSQRDIAKTCKVSQKTVSNVIRLYKSTGSVSPRRLGKCGRKRKTTRRDDRRLLQESIRFPKKTSSQLKRDLPQIAGAISSRTVRRRLWDAGRPARRPIKKQLLTQVMKRKRYAWAKAHEHWTPEMWSRVTFSDESHFEVQGQRLKYVRRSVGEPVRSGHIEQYVKHPDKKMFWGCFSVEGPGALQAVDGMMNSGSYMEVLTRKLIPYMETTFPNQDGIFQQDLAPCHKSRKVTDFLIQQQISVLPWPGNSPDVSPIENLWAIIKKRLKDHDCSSKVKLMEAVLSVWFHDEEIKNSCKNLIESMPKRVAMLIKARGGHIKY